MARGNAELVRRAFSEFGREPTELWDPEVEIANPAGWVLATTYHGHEGILRWWSDLDEAFVGFGLELDEVIEIDDDRVLTIQRFVGRFRATGIPFDGEWGSIITVRDGRVVRAEGFMSRRRAFRAAGLEPR